MKRCYLQITIVLMFFISSIYAQGQYREILHQTFEVDTMQEVVLDVFGDYKLELWAGNTIMTETKIEFQCNSKGILNFLIGQGRYDLEGISQGKVLSIVSKDKIRNPVRNNDKDCVETVALRIFIPEKFQKSGEHSWQNPDVKDPEEDD